MRDKTEIFKALAEPNRVRIILMLLKKPLCGCEITSILKLKTATVSNHLSVLRQAGFVTDEKDGKWINYKINFNSNDSMINTLLDNLSFWFNDEDVIVQDHFLVKSVDRFSIVCNGNEIKWKIWNLTQF